MVRKRRLKRVSTISKEAYFKGVRTDSVRHLPKPLAEEVSKTLKQLYEKEKKQYLTAEERKKAVVELVALREKISGIKSESAKKILKQIESTLYALSEPKIKLKGKRKLSPEEFDVFMGLQKKEFMRLKEKSKELLKSAGNLTYVPYAERKELVEEISRDMKILSDYMEHAPDEASKQKLRFLANKLKKLEEKLILPKK
ncbi:hypothetical protein DRN74_02795 [Candidatus Micrarchaeota archaeon]|nr:MAG: hypothetical protein DRN74_02795 [Candidatus Micrarchaeota archaeon]